MTKAIFFDIDGTLVSMKTHQMTDKVLETLYKLKDKGIRLFIASGRPPQIIDNLRGFPFDGIIAMNGGLTLVGGEVIDSHPLDKEDALRIAKISNANNIPAFISSDSGCGINIMNDISWEMFALIKIGTPAYLDLEKIAAEENIYQYTIYVSAEEEMKLFRPEIKNADFPRWHPAFADVVPKGISKSVAIGKICHLFGIDIADTIAFGDGDNDISMLKSVGFGIAMGNATDSVKASADMITLSVEDDGIVEALEKLGTI